MGNMEQYWERVTRLREALGLSKEELAERAGVTASYIYRIEKGQVETPSYATVRGLAEALHITPVQLMGDDGAAPPAPALDPLLDLLTRLAPNTPLPRLRRLVRLYGQIDPHKQEIIVELMSVMAAETGTPATAPEDMGQA